MLPTSACGSVPRRKIDTIVDCAYVVLANASTRILVI